VLDPPETNQRLEIKTKHSHISHSSQAEYTPTHRAVSTQPFASASGLSLIPALPFPQPLLLELTASPPCSCPGDHPETARSLRSSEPGAPGGRRPPHQRLLASPGVQRPDPSMPHNPWMGLQEWICRKAGAVLGCCGLAVKTE
jgi:hypothetical protein